GDHVPAQTYIDLDVSQRVRLKAWGLASDAKIDFGVENLFDTSPPRQASLSFDALAGAGYSRYGDPRRRRFELTLGGWFWGPGVLGGRRRQEVGDRVRHPHQLGQAARAHLPHRRTPVDLHRHLAEAEVVGDLFVQAAGRHLRHHLALARPKLSEP